ncbi:hypothetical protein AcW1_003689 [Taiwanofungus camphoratus]|nr:hypothetical protein AcW1_003689 [Antrodia cinnamomea]
MQSVLSKLLQKAEERPDSKLLQEVISRLSQSQNSTWEIVKHDLDRLTAEGLWETSDENEKLLEELRMILTGQESVTPPGPSEAKVSKAREGSNAEWDIPIVVPLPESTRIFPAGSSDTVLPIELINVLDHTYFFHLLATDPEKALPPGKSLLSVLSRPRSQTHRQEGDLPTLHYRVEDLVHRAFWDEAFETLSNPSPAVQLPRLKRLYEDLSVALAPLLPARHPVLVTLSSPLSPTSSPLLLAITHLREILACLRTRCAPARDPSIDSLVHGLDLSSSVTSVADIARLIVNTVQSILELSEAMRDDLAEFVLGSMSERQLRAVVANQAMKHERKVVLSLWSSQRIQTVWKNWLADLQPPQPQASTKDVSSHRTWVSRLVQALGSTIPVTCTVPMVSHPQSPPFSQETNGMISNDLPPPLFFTCPTLLYIQNYLQALVIAASLRSLVRLPSIQSSSMAASSNLQWEDDYSGGSFMARVWALLKAEVDGEPDAGDTKLVNLADEVIRVYRLFSGKQASDTNEDARLRAAVDRTLQSNDPVFLLLQKRLLQALVTRFYGPQVESSKPANAVPERLRAGHQSSRKKPMFMPEVDESEGSGDNRVELPLIVKGFEDEVLVRALGEGLVKLKSCVDWTERVWKDLIETGELTDPPHDLER